MKRLPLPLPLLVLLPLLAGGAQPATPAAADDGAGRELLVHLQLFASAGTVRLSTAGEATLSSGSERTALGAGAELEAIPVPGAGRFLLFRDGELVASLSDAVIRSSAPFRVPGEREPVGPAAGLRLFAEKGEVRGVLRVGLRDYIAGVLVGELGERSPLEALKAQAVAARSYVTRRMGEKGIAYREHLGATTRHQVFRHAPTPEKIRRAVAETEGEILMHRGRPALALYSACCGGATAAAEEAFGGGAKPYLPSHFDRDDGEGGTPAVSALAALEPAHCSGDPLFRWTRRFDADRLGRRLGMKGAVESLRVDLRHGSGRARRLAATTGAKTRKLDAARVREALDLPSTLFFVARADDGAFVFAGGGFGHGAGLCQSGACALARRGRDYRAILSFYYPGTELLRIY